jgi:hypothetical protein
VEYIQIMTFKNYSSLSQTVLRTKSPADAGRPASAGRTGRRRCGTVGAAVVAVLQATADELPVQTIHAQVELLLDGPVSRYSVADYLRRRSQGAKPLFLKTRFGHYRLAV